MFSVSMFVIYFTLTALYSPEISEHVPDVLQSDWSSSGKQIERTGSSSSPERSW